MKKSLKIAIAVLALESLAAVYYTGFKPMIEQDEFYELYQKAIRAYTKANHIQYTTSTDLDIINEGFLGRHKARYNYDGLPLYTDGTTVPLDSLRQWAEEYEGK